MTPKGSSFSRPKHRVTKQHFPNIYDSKRGTSKTPNNHIPRRYTTMRYLDTGILITPKHCKYGPRPAEGLLFNPYEWWSITDHLYKEEREKEITAVQKAKETAKKEISFNMTRNWDNTLASMKTLGDQKRIEKMERMKQEKIDKYNEILRSRKEEKAEIIAQARKVLYENRDSSKSIKSALLFSTVLKGREKQIEFKNAIERELSKKDEEYVEKFRKEAEEFRKEEIQERVDDQLKKKAQRAELDKQMSEIRLRKRAEEEELELEKRDLINMNIEAERIKKCNFVERNLRREIAKRYHQKSQNQIEFEKRLMLEQEEEDEINEIYKHYDKRFRDERKEREAKVREAAIEKRRKLAEEVGKIMAESEAKEDFRLQAAVDEEEEHAKRREEEEERLRKECREDMIEAKKQAERRFERSKQERMEETKWEMLQIHRTKEINDEWKESERKRIKECIAAARAAWDEQCRELEERRKEEKKDREDTPEDTEKEKEDVLKYCNEAMCYVAKHGLPPYPVVRQIEAIKKEYGMLTEKDKKDQNEPPRPKQGPRGSGCYCFKY